MKISKLLLILFGGLLNSPLLFAADICNDLAKLSCAPGAVNDGTGTVKSEDEVQNELNSFAEKAKTQIKNKFSIILNDPNNSYFNELAMSALGLKGNPICESQNPAMQAQCKKNLIDGLSMWGQRIALGKLLPNPSLLRDGNYKDMSRLVKNSHFKKVIAEIKENSRKELVDQKLVEKIENKIFPKVKETLIARIKELNISEKSKKYMMSKVNSIEFAGTNCEDLDSNSNLGMGDTVADLFAPNAFYTPSSNTFKFCDGYLLQSSSEFQIVTSIAHELSHSIDPCHINDGPDDIPFKYSDTTNFLKMENEYPLSNVTQCLRNKSSIQAHNFTFEDSKKSESTESGSNVVSSAPARIHRAEATSVSESESKMANFCDGDQITESFCDWLAAETLPRYMENNHKLSSEQYRLGYMNARKVLCEVKTEAGREAATKKEHRDEHPLIEDRINKIFLVNNKIRQQMKCPSEPTHAIYCDPAKQYLSPYLPETESSNPTTTPTSSPEPTTGVVK